MLIRSKADGDIGTIMIVLSFLIRLSAQSAPCLPEFHP